MRIRRKRGRFTSAFSLRHGHTVNCKRSPEYSAFQDAKSRCTNKRRPDYCNYGGRGIEFRFKSFEQFLAAVGRKPSPELVLDRIDNNGHYERGNMRWTTRSESLKNRRMTKRMLRASRKSIAIASKFRLKSASSKS